MQEPNNHCKGANLDLRMLIAALKTAHNYIETYGVAGEDDDGTKLTPQAAAAIAPVRAAIAMLNSNRARSSGRKEKKSRAVDSDGTAVTAGQHALLSEMLSYLETLTDAPSGQENAEARAAIPRYRAALANLSVLCGPAPEPAGAQYRAPGETWEWCGEHEEGVMRARGYEFRLLYVAPASMRAPADDGSPVA